MTLGSPLALLALGLIPAIAAAYALARGRRRRLAVRFPGTAVFAASATGRAGWRRLVPPALLTGAAAVLAVAFAEPQASVAVPVEKASVVLVTDESGSMAADDVDPSRLDAARGAAKSFLDRVPDSLQVGFVAYSSGTNDLVEPTSDHGRVRGALDRLQADGGTATGDALNAALDRLASRRGKDGRRAPAAIVLLSDGKTTDGSDPLTAAQRAKRLGIPISTVALGTPGAVLQGPMGETIPVPPDPDTLREISRVTGGTFTEADSADRLDSVYKDLGSKIGTKHVRRQVTSSFTAAGLVLLLAGLGTGLRWRGRLA
jgi:Ca-activated chloride channel family protein